MTSVDHDGPNVCRVSVRACGNDAAVAADVVLPTRTELHELIPDVVDVLGGPTAWSTGDALHRWTVSRIDGSVLDGSLTLHEHGVEDGDLLLIAATPTRLSPNGSGDLCDAVVAASAAADDTDVARRLGAIACLCAGGAGALALMWAGAPPAGHRAAVAAIAAVAAGLGALACRTDPDPLPAVTLGVTATVLAAVAGFLAVPSGPAPPNFFLGAAVCAAASVVLVRTSAHGGICFVAVAAFSITAATVAACASVWQAPTATVGAILTAASLALTSIAARLAIALARLSPAVPTNDVDVDDLPPDVCAARARRGHELVTGLLIGFSASAAAGSVIVAAADSTRPPSGVALVAAVSLALLLRTRQHSGMARSAAVFGGGLVSATAAFTLAVRAAPSYSHWLGLIAVAVGLGAVTLTTRRFTRLPSPVARRGVHLVDCLAIAAVAPLACWVADLFGVVRGLSLT